MLVSALHSFRGTMIISKEYSHLYIVSTCTVYFSEVKVSSDLFLLTHFLSVYFRTPVAVKQTFYWSSYIFRGASINLKWEQPLKAATFLQKDSFRTPSCLEELLLFNNYFLVRHPFSDQLLFDYKYFISTANVMFWRSYLLRISNYSKHVLFQSRCFFRIVTFSDE